jgi:hypothetical protein
MSDYTAPDYSKAIIYTIRCHSDTSLIYVGSTVQPLYVRWKAHKRESSNPNSRNYNNKFYQKIRETSIDNWYIQPYEEFPCENAQQLHIREGEIIRKISTLNQQIPGRTKEQHKPEAANIKERKDIVEANRKHKQTYIEKVGKEAYLQQMRQYWAKNKDVLGLRRVLKKYNNSEYTPQPSMINKWQLYKDHNGIWCSFLSLLYDNNTIQPIPQSTNPSDDDLALTFDIQLNDNNESVAASYSITN